MSTEENMALKERVSFKMPAHIHRELKIEAAHTDQEMIAVLEEVWETYKISVPQPWRERKGN